MFNSIKLGMKRNERSLSQKGKDKEKLSITGIGWMSPKKL